MLPPSSGTSGSVTSHYLLIFRFLNRNSIIKQRDELQASLVAIYEAAPQTNGKAYLEAQDRLKNKEDLTFSPEEIDHFLPLSLKRAGARRAALSSK